MTNQVIFIDKKKYATGLFWQPVASGLMARTYAHQLVRTTDKKLGMYAEYRSMVGLGSRRLGHHIGMSSAAAEVVESFAEYSSFLAAFKVQEVFWLVSVRNGIVVYDNAFDSEDEAKAEFSKLFSMPDWGSVFAPGSWSIPRSLEKRIEDIVTGNVRAYLKPISHLKADLVSFVLLILFILGLAHFFKEPISQMLIPKPQIAKIDPMLAQEYKKRIEEKNKELDKRFEIEKPKPAEPLKMPYNYLPDRDARAKLCYQTFGFFMQDVPGWNQVNMECNEEYANVVFKRSFGNLNDFYNVATELIFVIR